MKVSERDLGKVTPFKKGGWGVEGPLECGSIKFLFLFPLSCTLKCVSTPLKQQASGLLIKYSESLSCTWLLLMVKRMCMQTLLIAIVILFHNCSPFFP